jgi:4-carboxymuconolactone decarboxylase
VNEEKDLSQDTFDKGLQMRTQVLGQEYVDKAVKGADDFNRPFQDLLTEYCWGAVWGREDLPLKTRSMLTLTVISVLNRPQELRTHLRAALTNGVTRDEIREIFMHVAIYAGMPTAVDCFRIAQEVFAELDQG